MVSPLKAPKAVQMVRTISSKECMRLREKNTLSIFKRAAAHIPAYAHFLNRHGIDPANIKSLRDFQKVPPTSKADYLREYPLVELCWNGTLARPGVFSATSGSTGKPFYFQRSQNLEEEYSVLVELFLSQGTRVPSPECPTLVIIGFGMGVWIGGMLTYRAYEIASQRGYPVSILPAGVNKGEILNALRELAPQFKQTVLIGYPPFIKLILDEAELEGIDLHALNLRLQFAAESFTEQFRDYLGEKAGIQNVMLDTLNVYGTADIGAMAFETPIAILVRRLAMQNEELFTSLFGDTKKTPTLTQYNPAFMSFETNENEEILLTGNSAIPLIRYAVGDHGGVHSFDDVEQIFAKEGIDLRAEARKHNIPVYQLPFVYVYARVDLSKKLYGAIMYPEHVREALEDPTLLKSISGKFTMQTLTDEEHNQFLEINIELRPDAAPTEELKEIIAMKVVENLLHKSSEYENNHKSLGNKVIPHVVLWPYGDPTYFKPGIKQQWVKK